MVGPTTTQPCLTTTQATYIVFYHNLSIKSAEVLEIESLVAILNPDFINLRKQALHDFIVQLTVFISRHSVSDILIIPQPHHMTIHGNKACGISMYNNTIPCLRNYSDRNYAVTMYTYGSCHFCGICICFQILQMFQTFLASTTYVTKIITNVAIPII